MTIDKKEIQTLKVIIKQQQNSDIDQKCWHKQYGIINDISRFQQKF